MLIADHAHRGLRALRERRQNLGLDPPSITLGIIRRSEISAELAPDGLTDGLGRSGLVAGARQQN
jgi:hypothetical protein